MLGYCNPSWLYVDVE